jgi:hypothetical protein
MDAATTLTCGTDTDEAHTLNLARLKKQQFLHEQFSAKRWAERVDEEGEEFVRDARHEVGQDASAQVKARRASIAASVRVRKLSAMDTSEVRAAMMSMRGGMDAEEADLDDLIDEEFDHKAARMHSMVQRWLNLVDRLESLDDCAGAIRDASGERRPPPLQHLPAACLYTRAFHMPNSFRSLSGQTFAACR